MDLRQVKDVVSKIQISLFKNSNSFSIGMLKSHFRGSGLQFKEHQVYAHGDDIRFIDWKMVAKTGDPFIKTFEEERNVEIVVVIDAGRSMLLGYEGKTKLQAAIEITCLLYLLAKETNDFIHAIVLSDKVINIPKKKGEAGISLLIGTLEKEGIITDSGNINIDFYKDKSLSDDNRNVTTDVMRHLKNRHEVVILSDLVDNIDLPFVNRIIKRSNVHCFEISSPLDRMSKLPFSLLGSSYKSEKGKRFKIKSKEEEEVSLKNPHIKNLKIEERYLEDFIKEML